jgi:chromosome segregation ATPase
MEKDTKKRSHIRSIIHLNNELKSRLIAASVTLKEKDDEINSLRRNLQRSGEAVVSSETEMRELDNRLQEVRKENADLSNSNESLRAEVERLTRELEVSKSEAKSVKRELERTQENSKAAMDEKSKQMAKQLSVAAMHSAGLEAQIKEMRSKHPGSELLRDTEARLNTGERKSRLRQIYEDAFNAKGRQLGLMNPFEEMIPG